MAAAARTRYPRNVRTPQAEVKRLLVEGFERGKYLLRPAIIYGYTVSIVAAETTNRDNECRCVGGLGPLQPTLPVLPKDDRFPPYGDFLAPIGELPHGVKSSRSRGSRYVRCAWNCRRRDHNPDREHSVCNFRSRKAQATEKIIAVARFSGSPNDHEVDVSRRSFASGAHARGVCREWIEAPARDSGASTDAAATGRKD